MPTSKTPYLPALAETTIERRTLLSWLGKGTVLALSGLALPACGGSSGGAPASTPAPKGFSFSPGPDDHPIYERWGERTVDRQKPEDILARWKLSVTGLVESPGEVAFADLLALERTDQTTDFHCVEGWSVYDVPWNGVLLSRLLERARPLANATHVHFYTVGDRYNESLPLEIAQEPRTLLAYGIGGSSLPLKHGFPARIVIPRLLGYKNAKYVERIELADHPLSGYWVQYGYPYAGNVPASRLRPGKH